LQKDLELQEKRMRKEYEKQEVVRKKVNALGKVLAYNSEPPLVLQCVFVLRVVTGVGSTLVIGLGVFLL